MFVKIFGKLWKNLPKSSRRWLTRRVQTSFTVSAAGVISNENGEILLLNHVLRPGPSWGLPGGFIDTGEQPADGLRREIREETGLELENVELVHARTLHRHVELIFHATAAGEASVSSREITDLGWFTLESMPAETAADHRCIIDLALRRTGFGR